ncbi:MAG: hypothetical protein AAF628_10670 [Planctomycetota bacterium]
METVLMPAELFWGGATLLGLLLGALLLRPRPADGRLADEE